MNIRRRIRRVARALPVASLGLFVWSADLAPVWADEPGAVAPAAAVKVVTLDQAVQMALAQQPAVQAARASLNSTLTQRETANSTMSFLSGPQIHTRRKQADLGVAIAQANVDEAELNVVYAVTRTYLTAVYARDQVKVTQQAVDSLEATRRVAESQVKAGAKEVTKSDLDRISTYVLLAQTRLETARQGVVRAKAALREAMGICNSDLEIADDTLARYYDTVVNYCGGAPIDCKSVAQVAINSRPEITQASLAAQVSCLEIEAQGLSLHIYSKTFAATSDIHSKVLPAGSTGDEYRPGAVGPEMPVFLAGSRTSRMERAGHLYERAVAVTEKAKGLVALEVEDACLRLQQEGNQVTLLRKAIDQAAKAVKDAEQAYRDDQLKTDQMIAIQVVEAQTRGQLNETMYRYGLALASLQRATAGKLWECVAKPVTVETPKSPEPQKLPR